jgi:hypothetical protein
MLPRGKYWVKCFSHQLDNFFFFFCYTGIWTQDLTTTWATPPALFYVKYFWDMVCLFAWASFEQRFSWVTRIIIGVSHQHLFSFLSFFFF